MKRLRIIQSKEQVILPELPYGNIIALCINVALDISGKEHYIKPIFKCRGGKCIVMYIKSHLDNISQNAQQI